MSEVDKEPIRISISMHPGTASFLRSRRVAGRSRSQRIGRLAERYAAVMAGSDFLRKMVPAELAAVIRACEGLSLDQAKDVLVVPGRVKLAMQAGELEGLAMDPSALAYRLDRLDFTDLLRLVDAAECYEGPQPATSESVIAWLQARAKQPLSAAKVDQ